MNEKITILKNLIPVIYLQRKSELSRGLDNVVVARLPFDLRNLRAGQSRVSAPFLEENAEFLSLVSFARLTSSRIEKLQSNTADG